MIEGFPDGGILRVAKVNDAVLIALGAHEHGLSHTFLGTVSRRIKRRAEVSTLVVPYRSGGRTSTLGSRRAGADPASRGKDSASPIKTQALAQGQLRSAL